MEVINKVGLLTIALIDDASIKVKKARSNHKNTDFTKDLILIDNLGAAQKVGTSDSFDGINEIGYYSDYYKQVFTFDFYGSNAFDLANNFIALMRSQAGYDLQQSSALSFYRHSQISDLKQLVGTTYNNRYQIEFSVRYSINVEIPTLRIDTLNLEELIFDRPRNIVNQNPPAIIETPDIPIVEEGDYFVSNQGNRFISNQGSYFVSNE